jgi:hypothetical protein
VPAFEARQEAAFDAARLAPDEVLEDRRVPVFLAGMRVPAVSGCRT